MAIPAAIEVFPLGVSGRGKLAILFLAPAFSPSLSYFCTLRRHAHNQDINVFVGLHKLIEERVVFDWRLYIFVTPFRACFEDCVKRDNTTPDSYFFDGLHFNAKGHHVLATCLVATVRRLWGLATVEK